MDWKKALIVTFVILFVFLLAASTYQSFHHEQKKTAGAATVTIINVPSHHPPLQSNASGSTTLKTTGTPSTGVEILTGPLSALYSLATVTDYTSFFMSKYTLYTVYVYSEGSFNLTFVGHDSIVVGPLIGAPDYVFCPLVMGASGAVYFTVYSSTLPVFSSTIAAHSCPLPPAATFSEIVSIGGDKMTFWGTLNLPSSQITETIASGTSTITDTKGLYYPIPYAQPPIIYNSTSIAAVGIGFGYDFVVFDGSWTNGHYEGGIYAPDTTIGAMVLVGSFTLSVSPRP